MEWYTYPLTIVAGILVGFVNVIAGGGSVLSLPLLVFLGLDANVANGTNRINILITSIVGIRTLKQKEEMPYKKGLRFLVPSVLGAIIGALFAVDLNEELMKQIIGIVLIIVFFVILYKPKQWLKGSEELIEKKYWWQIPLFFLLGFYGGFIQAGAGLFIIITFVLGAGYDLMKANLMKLLIFLLYTPIVIGIFIMNDQMNYMLGILLAIGATMGAIIGSKLALKRGTKFIRYMLLGVTFFSAIKFLGVIHWLQNHLF